MSSPWRASGYADGIDGDALKAKRAECAARGHEVDTYIFGRDPCCRFCGVPVIAYHYQPDGIRIEPIVSDRPGPLPDVRSLTDASMRRIIAMMIVPSHLLSPGRSRHGNPGPRHA